VIASFHRSAKEICVLFGFYAAQSGSSLPTFRDNLSAETSRFAAVQEEDYMTTEDGIDNLFPIVW